MIYKSIILPLAKEDIRDAVHWYNKQQEGLGKKFSGAVRRKVKIICQHPDAYAVRYDATRVAVLEAFPYLIHFQTNGEDKTVLVTAVLHTKRSPENWLR